MEHFVAVVFEKVISQVNKFSTMREFERGNSLGNILRYCCVVVLIMSTHQQGKKKTQKHLNCLASVSEEQSSQAAGGISGIPVKQSQRMRSLQSWIAKAIAKGEQTMEQARTLQMLFYDREQPTFDMNGYKSSVYTLLQAIESIMEKIKRGEQKLLGNRRQGQRKFKQIQNIKILIAQKQNSLLQSLQFLSRESLKRERMKDSLGPLISFYQLLSDQYSTEKKDMLLAVGKATIAQQVTKLQRKLQNLLAKLVQIMKDLKQDISKQSQEAKDLKLVQTLNLILQKFDLLHHNLLSQMSSIVRPKLLKLKSAQTQAKIPQLRLSSVVSRINYQELLRLQIPDLFEVEKAINSRWLQIRKVDIELKKQKERSSNYYNIQELIKTIKGWIAKLLEEKTVLEELFNHSLSHLFPQVKEVLRLMIKKKQKNLLREWDHQLTGAVSMKDVAYHWLSSAYSQQINN